jgi:hypothetical protein
VDENPGSGKVEVKYYYGFSSEVGGGCYDRHFQPIPDGVQTYEVGKEESFDKISGAILEWTNDGKKSAVILIKDSRIYEESINIVIPAGISFEIRAADDQYPLLRLTAPLSVKGEDAATGQSRARFILEGLRICSKSLFIGDGDLGTLGIKHCTLIPGLDLEKGGEPTAPDKASLIAEEGNTGLKVTIERSICGGIELLDTHDLEIRESIIQGLEVKAINGSNLTVKASTIMGDVISRMIELASNTIFTGTVKAELTQKGCVRFCYVPEGSQVPRRFRCQPNLAIKEAITAASEIQSPLPKVKKAHIEKSIRLWLKPVFTDRDYGKPGYAQLSLICPKEISEGAEDGSEMGVFQHLQQPQRVANLRASLDEYLPANMEAGIFFIN